MRLQVLKVFLNIIEAGSFAAAAREQHMSQPAVSMLISNLEEELGRKLFLRSQGHHSHLELTRAGELFRDYAYKSVEDYNNLRIALVQEQVFSPVHIAVSPTPGSTILPLLIQEFKNDYPQIPCMVHARAGQDLLNCLLKRECDIVITGIPLQGYDIVVEAFFYDPIELICPISMGMNDSITLKQLQKLPLIIRNLHVNTTQLLIAALDEVGLTLEDMNVAMQVYGNSDVLQAVELGSGVGFVSRSLLSINPDHRKKVKIVQVKRLKINRNLHLARRQGHDFSVGAQIFWDYALDKYWRRKLFFHDTAPK